MRSLRLAGAISSPAKWHRIVLFALKLLGDSGEGSGATLPRQSAIVPWRHEGKGGAVLVIGLGPESASCLSISSGRSTSPSLSIPRGDERLKQPIGNFRSDAGPRSRILISARAATLMAALDPSSLFRLRILNGSSCPIPVIAQRDPEGPRRVESRPSAAAPTACPDGLCGRQIEAVR